MKLRVGAVLCIVVLAGGCQSTGPASSGNAESADSAPSQQSGFLGDYSQLKPVPDRKGVMAYVDRSVDLHPYTKLMFDPVKIVMTPNPDYKGVPQEALARMGDNFLASFRNALSPAYEIVNQPGPGVLRIRTAITGVQPVKPEMGAVDFLPIKAVFNAGREAAGAAPRVAEMTAEMEVLDPAGKRVMAVTANRKGEKQLAQGEKVTWNQLQEISDYWARNFRRRLDELRGVSPRKP